MSRKSKNKKRLLRKNKHNNPNNPTKQEAYDKYLQSGVWKHVRGWVLKRDENNCQLCQQLATEVHHISYREIVKQGCENHMLISLCHKCHHDVEFNGAYHRTVPERGVRLDELMQEQNNRTLDDWIHEQKGCCPDEHWNHLREWKWRCFIGDVPEGEPPLPIKDPNKKERASAINRRKKLERKAGVINELQAENKSIRDELKRTRAELFKRKMTHADLSKASFIEELKNEIKQMRRDHNAVYRLNKELVHQINVQKKKIEVLQNQAVRLKEPDPSPVSQVDLNNPLKRHVNSVLKNRT